MKPAQKHQLAALALALAGAASAQQLAENKADYRPMASSTAETSGFKASFAPTSTQVTGDTYSSTLKIEALDLMRPRWRIFVPPGTLRLYIDLTHDTQNTSTWIAARFKTPPSGTQAPVDPDETGLFDYASTLAKLEDGLELTFSSKAGQTIVPISSPVYDISLGAYKTSQGGWLYMRNLQGAPTIDLKIRADINKSCYATWYAGALWDIAGNPLQNATHTCAGTTSTGAEPTATEPDYTLTATTAQVRPGQTMTVSISPATITLASCTLSTIGSTTASTSMVITPGTNTLTASATAPSISGTATKLQVSCTSAGGKTASLQTTVPAEPVPEANFTLTHTTTDHRPGKPISVAVQPATTQLRMCTATTYGDTVEFAPLNIAQMGNSLTAAGTVPTLANNASATRLRISCSTQTDKTVTLYTDIVTPQEPDPITPATPARAVGIKSTASNGGIRLQATIYPASNSVGTGMRLWTGMLTTPFWGPATLVMRTSQGWRPMSAQEGLTIANILQTITPATTGTTITLLDGDMTEADLAAISATVYLAYQNGTGAMELFSQPLLACSGRTCAVPAPQ